MKMTKLGWCIGIGLFLGCATSSPTPTTTSQSAQSVQSAPGTQQQDGTKVAAAKKNKKEGLVCETYKVTGSHLRKEVCRTKEQMERDREQAEKLIREGDRYRPGEGNQ